MKAALKLPYPNQQLTTAPVTLEPLVLRSLNFREQNYGIHMALFKLVHCCTYGNITLIELPRRKLGDIQ
jgi:hypothetical protein